MASWGTAILESLFISTAIQFTLLPSTFFSSAQVFADPAVKDALAKLSSRFIVPLSIGQSLNRIVREHKYILRRGPHRKV